MSDEPENLVLVYLRRLDAKLDRVLSDIAELKLRQTQTTQAVVSLRRDQASDAETMAHVQAQVDQLRERLERVERRLDLVDEPPAK